MAEAVQYRQLPDGVLFWHRDHLYRKLGGDWALRHDTARRYRFWPEEHVRTFTVAEQPAAAGGVGP